jgi:acetyl-CoA synthetase
VGKPLRPENIFFIQALSKTRDSKVLRCVIRAAFLGEDPGDTTALENPAAESIRHAEEYFVAPPPGGTT